MPGVVLVGLGWAVRVQLPVFRSCGFEVVALVGRDAKATRAMAEQLGVPLGTDNIEEALALPNAHLVSVVTPPLTHAKYTLAALKAGLHVLTEKPFAADATEARLVADAHAAACRAHGRPLLGLGDHELRWHGGFLAARRFIAEGSFGRVSHVSVTFIGTMPAVLSDSWGWWNDASQMGGTLAAVGSHYIDLCMFLTRSEVVRVNAHLRTHVRSKTGADGESRACTSDDHAELQLLLRSSSSSPRASYRAHADAPAQEFHARISLMAASFGYARNEVVLLSDRGAITLDMLHGHATFQPATRQHARGQPDAAPIEWRSETAAEVADQVSAGYSAIDLYRRGTVTLVQRLRQGIEQIEAAAPAAASAASDASDASSSAATDMPAVLSEAACSFEDGVLIARVLDAAKASHQRDGAWVDLPMDVEQAKGDSHDDKPSIEQPSSAASSS